MITIQELLGELNTFDSYEERNKEYIRLYSEAVSRVRSGKTEEAKKSVKEALKLEPGFDEGRILLSLILFAQGNRIEAIRQVNDIEDDDSRARALSYVDALSGVENWRIEKKPEPLPEKPKKSEYEDVSIEFGSVDSLENEFAKRFFSAKEAQELDFEKRTERLTNGRTEFETEHEKMSSTLKAANVTPTAIDIIMAKKAEKIKLDEQLQNETFEPLIELDRESAPTDDTVVAEESVPELIIDLKLETENGKDRKHPERHAPDKDDFPGEPEDDDGEEEEYTKDNAVDKKKSKTAIVIIAVCIGLLAALTFFAIKMHMG